MSARDDQLWIKHSFSGLLIKQPAVRKPRKPREPSTLERDFMFRWRAINGPAYEPEFKFNPERRWRFDFAFPKAKVAIELEGGHWTNGRHTRGSGFEADCEKYNEAALAGWTVFRLTSGLIPLAYLERIASHIKCRTP